MTDKPQRRWFQIHLSTAVLLTVTAGCLVGVCCVPNPPLQYVRDHFESKGPAHYYGWPVSFAWHDYEMRRTNVFHHDFGYEYEPDFTKPTKLQLSWPMGLAIDFGLYALVLLIVARICEWSIRRRQRFSK